ncbi:DUF7701 domain-containing protein [Actinoplanes sp. NPDC049316]|uniref:DUF7701 domain-containing protein n=1 Tax=Actinoplanes sp. NPDC049316 TaxID=3154727 RepID=UPI00341906EF
MRIQDQNYVQPVIRHLNELLPGCDSNLLNLYALLAMTRGVNTSLEDVHDAWSIWRNPDAPRHRSLIPFEELTVEVQELDRKYMDAIRTAAVAEHERRQSRSATSRPAATAAPLILERVRTDDGAYRVFEPKGVGTGSVTYDPVIGEHGYLEVSAPLSQDFNEDAEERLLRTVLQLRGDDGVFERLEYVYQRQAERAFRPSLSKDGAE